MRAGTIFAVVGVSFRQEQVGAIQPGAPVILVHQADNPYDHLAVAVKDQNGGLLGYLPRSLAPRFSDPAEGGTPGGRWDGIVAEKTQFEQADGTVGYGLRIALS